MKINWITLRIYNLERSKDFYGNFLGMELFREFTGSDGRRFAFYRAENGMEIELVENGMVGERGLQSRQWSIGISVTDYERVLKEAQKRGFITEEPAPHVGKLEYFFAEYPDGTAFQIVKYSD